MKDLSHPSPPIVRPLPKLTRTTTGFFLNNKNMELTAPSPAPSTRGTLASLARCTSTPISINSQAMKSLIQEYRGEPRFGMTEFSMNSPALRHISPLEGVKKNNIMVSPTKKTFCQNGSLFSFHEEEEDSGVHTLSHHGESQTSIETTSEWDGKKCSIKSSSTNLISSQFIEPIKIRSLSSSSEGTVSYWDKSSLSDNGIESQSKLVSNDVAMETGNWSLNDTVELPNDENDTISLNADISQCSSIGQPIVEVKKEERPQLRCSPRLKAKRQAAVAEGKIKSPLMLQLPPQRNINRRVFKYNCGQFRGYIHIDIIRHLFEMNMKHVTNKIFSYLDDSDLCAIACVTTTWNSCLKQNFAASSRKNAYLIRKRLNQENFPHRLSRQCHRSPRKALLDKSNISDTSLRSNNSSFAVPDPVLIANRSCSRDLFPVEEEKETSPDRPSIGSSTIKCPRCGCSSKVFLSVAQCTQSSCEFFFCTKCSLAVHDNKPCFNELSTSKKPNTSLNRKKTRKILRRL